MIGTEQNVHLYREIKSTKKEKKKKRKNKMKVRFFFLSTQVQNKAQ